MIRIGEDDDAAATRPSERLRLAPRGAGVSTISTDMWRMGVAGEAADGAVGMFAITLGIGDLY